MSSSGQRSRFYANPVTLPDISCEQTRKTKVACEEEDNVLKCKAKEKTHIGCSMTYSPRHKEHKSVEQEEKREETLENLEYVLLLYDYVPVSRICFPTQDAKYGDYICNYVEAYNKKGQKVLVHLDREGILNEDKERDEVYVESKEGVVVPESIITSADQCAKFDICGIAFRCSDGVCMTTRDKNFKSQTSKFTFAKNCEHENIAAGYEKVADNTQYEYLVPVVKLQDIQADPERVFCNTDKVYSKILRNTQIAAACKVAHFSSCLNSLTHSFECADGKIGEYWQELEDSLNKLENIHQGYRECPPCTEESKKKYDLVLYNLKKRYELWNKMVNLCNKFDWLSQEVCHTKEHIDKIDEELQMFEDVGYVYEM